MRRRSGLITAVWVATMLGAIATLSTLGLALFTAVALLALLFPDERLPGRRWRIPVALTLGALIASAVLFAVQPGPMNTDLAASPLGIDSELVAALGQLALPLETLGILAGAVFAGVVVGLQAALAPVTSNNTLAVAASTLVARSAGPLASASARGHHPVDRRFDRSATTASGRRRRSPWGFGVRSTCPGSRPMPSKRSATPSDPGP